MNNQLISYIAPSAPATRRPATGSEPFVRPEIGFTPAWYRQHLDLDFGERWHTDVDYRRETVIAMRADFERIARDYAPCDIVIADVEAGTPDQRVQFALDLCSTLSKQRKA
mgnify:CR=1 FL=1